MLIFLKKILLPGVVLFLLFIFTYLFVFKPDKQFVLTNQDILTNAEFYSESFSQQYKDAYIIYGKAGFALANENDKEKAYSLYTQAISSFVQIYNDQDLSAAERSYALNLINCIYIGTHWDDNFFVKTLFTLEPFKSNYIKNFEDLKVRFGDKSNLPDTLRSNQNILIGAASQLSMSDLNKLSYELHPIGYSLLRMRMNDMSSSMRLLDISRSSSQDDQQARYARYVKEKYGLQNLLQLKGQIEEMSKDFTLYEGMGRIVHEIYIMKTVVLWDPLISQTVDKNRKVEYLASMKNDFLRGADIAKGSPLIGVSTMVNLFYVSFLGQYAFANPLPNQLLTEEEKTAYKDEAIVRTLNIIKYKNSPYLLNILKENEYLSYRPKNIPESFDYFGGVPYYQLRQLAEVNQEIKNYLQTAGWKF